MKILILFALSATIFASTKSTFLDMTNDSSDEPGLSKEELGRHGWGLLHTIAAYYPEDADAAYLAMTYQWLEDFALLYPCPMCAKHFQALLADNPPNFQTRDELVIYICNLHNAVNKDLDKDLLECTLYNMYLLWGGDTCPCENSL